MTSLAGVGDLDVRASIGDVEALGVIAYLEDVWNAQYPPPPQIFEMFEWSDDQQHLDETSHTKMFRFGCLLPGNPYALLCRGSICYMFLVPSTCLRLHVFHWIDALHRYSRSSIQDDGIAYQLSQGVLC